MSGDSTPPAKGHRVARAFLRWGGRALVAGVLLLLTLLALLQIDAVATAATRRVVRMALPDGATATVARVSGSVWRSLTLDSITIRRANGDTALSAVRLDARYRLLPLLSGTVALRHLEARDLRVTMIHRADSTWGLFPSAGPPDAGGGWRFEVDQAVVRGGSVSAVLAPDSTHRLADLVLLARDLRVGPEMRGTIDTLTGSIRLAGHPDQSGELVARLSWDSVAVQIDTLLVDAPGTHLVAAGTLPLTLTRGRTEGTTFRIRAAPLALDDLTPFFPMVGGAPITGELSLRGGAQDQLVGNGSFRTADGASLELEARVQVGPDAPVSIVARGTIQEFDPSSVMTTPGVEGLVNGNFDVTLAGPDLLHLSGSVSADLERSRLRTYQLHHALLSAEATEGRYQLLVEARLDEYTLKANGKVDPTADSLTYRIEATIAGGALGAGSAQVIANGHGDPRQGTVEFSARLDSAAVIRAGLSTLTASGRLYRGDLAMQLQATIGTGELSARLVGAPFADQPLLTVQEGRLEHLDLAVLSPSAPPTSLAGRFRGQIRGFDPGSMAANVLVSLDSSQVGQALLRSGEVRLDLAAQRIGFDGTLAFATGQVQLEGEAHPFSAPISYEIGSARFTTLNLGAILARPDWPTSLSGALSLAGEGIEPTTRRVTATLDLDASTVRGMTLTSAHLNGELIGDSIRVAATTGLGSGRIELTGWARLSDSLGTLVAAATMNAGGATWRGITADSAHAAVRIGAGTLTLDTLWVHSALASAHGGGTVPLVPSADSANLTITSELRSIEPIRAAFELPTLAVGTATGSVRITGTSDSLLVAGRTGFDALRYGESRMVGFLAEADLVVSVTEGLRQATGFAEFQELNLPRSAIALTRLDAEYDAEAGLRLKGKSQIDQNRTAELEANLDPAAEQPVWTVDRMDMAIGQDRWSLLEPARIRYRPGLRIEPLVLQGPDRRIALGGVLDSAGIHNFRLSAEAFPVEAVADLLGYEQLSGDLDLTIEIQGTTAAPTAEGNLALEIRTPAGRLGTVTATGALTNGQLRLEGSIAQDEAPTLRLEGEIPWAVEKGAARSLDFTVQADSFRIQVFEAFVPPEIAHTIRGRTSGRFRIQGTTESPVLEGQLAMEEGRIDLPQLGVTWRNIDITTRLAGESLRVEQARLTSGGGVLTAEGDIHMQRWTLGELALALRAEEFQAIDNEVYQAVVTGQVRLEGTTAAPAVRGTLTVQRGDVYLDGAQTSSKMADVTLTEADYEELEAYFGYPILPTPAATIPELDALTLDLTVHLGRDTWLRQDANPRMALQLTGQMQVRKEPGPVLDMLGEVSMIAERSYVQQFGRRFELRTGQVRFRGDRLDTQLDLTAAHTVPSRTDPEPEAVIVMRLEGSVGNLRVELSAEPSMSNEDIVSYLATGRPAGQALSLGDGSDRGGLLSTGAGLALDPATGLIEGLAAEHIGLDVIDIRRDPIHGTTLVAGRYVSPTLYLGFQQPLSQTRTAEAGTSSQSRTRVEIELEVYRWLLLNFESGGGALQFFLKARHGY